MNRFLNLALAALLPISAASAPSPLADAAERSDHSAIGALLRTNADVNAPQPDGMTALHWAVYNDDTYAAKLFIQSGANVKAENRYGVTPLSLSCLNGNTELVESLLEAGADPNATLPGGETALMTAARTGKPGPVKALIARGADINARERRNQTALMWAAADGHLEVVQLLIKSGADYLSPLDSGFTPFFFAVREGHSPLVHLFLKTGIDVNAAMDPRRTTGRGPRKNTSPLLLAMENGHFELAVELLKAGADPNDARTGITPLHAMIPVRKPNRGDGDNDIPPPTGSGNIGSLEFIRKLVEHGADVNARLKAGKTGRGQLGRDGATPFLLAADTADVPLMRLLVKLGADPLLANSDGCTPLMAAAGIGTLAPGEEAGTDDESLAAVQLMLELGDDVNAVDKNGETAMHGAAYKNNPRMVQFLADKGAKIEIWNQKNKYGWTPLLIAEGYRPGNFRPSADTIAALHGVMLAAGVQPPTNTVVSKDASWNDDAPAQPSALQ